MAAAVSSDDRIHTLLPQITFEVRDVDMITTVEKLKKTLKPALGAEKAIEARVGLSRSVIRGTRLAMITVNAEAAKILEGTHRIRIAFCLCRVRPKVAPDRCYKCQGYGHIAAPCTGPHRAGLCWRCGKAGQKSVDCKENPCCLVCKDDSRDTKHASGSRQCLAYRTSMEARLRRRNGGDTARQSG